MSATAPLPISIVVCVRNRAAELEVCLASLQGTGAAEILVIDGASTDATATVARQMGATVITDGGRGLGYARRLGVLHASQPYIMFVDSDVRFARPEILQEMLDELVLNDYTGLHAQLHSDKCQTIWERAQDIHWQLTFNIPGPRAWVGCVAVLFRRDALLRCLPDPFFAGAAEDGDLSRRLVADGGRLGVAHTGVIHAHRSTCRALWNQRVWYGRGNARRAWKDGTPVPLAGPLLTAAYLLIQALLRQKPSLIPYAFVHGIGGTVGVASELVRLTFASIGMNQNTSV